MRSLVLKLTAAALAAVLVFGFFAAAPAASAQTYPPVGPTGGLTGTEILFVIQASAAVDAASAAPDAASAQAAADDVAAILVAAENANAAAEVIAEIEAAVLEANAAAAAAGAADEVLGISIDAASPVADSAQNLAFTGSDVNLPLAAGAILVGSGGLLLLAARKREQRG